MESVPDQYHKYFYHSLVWDHMTYCGVKLWKSPMDLWLYHEIIFDLKPTIIFETGSAFGGSALFFADQLKTLDRGKRGYNKPRKVLSCDVDMSHLADIAKAEDMIEFVQGASLSPDLQLWLKGWLERCPGPIFAILDDSHYKNHVLAEMLFLRDILKSGDYLIVEDGNVNGHPVAPEWGEGPFEAIKEYETICPNDYAHDKGKEEKFGWTFAPSGFLVRK